MALRAWPGGYTNKGKNREKINDFIGQQRRISPCPLRWYGRKSRHMISAVRRSVRTVLCLPGFQLFDEDPAPFMIAFGVVLPLFLHLAVSLQFRI